MKKILAIDREPWIRSYQYLGYPFSILGKDEKSLNWLCNNFIQLVRDGENPLTYYMDFLDKQDALECETIPVEWISYLESDILELLKKILMDERYLYVCLDEYYVVERAAFQREHYIHDCLIYGFDDLEQVFYILGYDKQEKYVTGILTYEGLVSSGLHYRINALQKNKKYIFQLDLPKIHLDIQRYLNDLQQPIIGDFHFDQAAFGQRAIHIMIKSIEKQMTHQEQIDLRDIFLIYEHKQIMYLRLQKLKKEIGIPDHIIQNYQGLRQMGKNVLLKSMMYNAQTNRTFPLVNKIQRMMDEEKEILNEVIQRFGT